MLPQIATFVRVDLGARIIQVLVFNERAELRSEIVIRSCDHLPGKVCMTSPSAGTEASVRPAEVEPRRFRIVDADSCPGVWLEFSKGESADEVPHEGSCVDKGRRAGLSEYVPVCKSHGGISAP